MNILDQIFLLLTGLTAIYLVFRFYQDFQKTKKRANIHYMVSFLVLLVSGLLLIFYGYGILNSQWVKVVAYLIPFLLAQGLVCEFYEDKAKYYLVFGIIGLLLIAFAPGSLKVVSLATFHSVAGLLIFFLPIIVTKSGKAPSGFIWVTVGGTLIGLGGVALAFLKAGTQFLFFSADFVFTILAPLLLLMALAYTYGFMKKMNG
jgi:hypothetical protein